MPICTYISDSEAKAWKYTHDEDIDKAVESIRKLTGEKILVQYSYISTHGRWWWRKQPTTIVFSLYLHVNEIEYEIVNFAPPDYNTYSINTEVSRQTLLAFLHGYISGLLKRNNKLKE